jgi:hypothetical protein
MSPPFVSRWHINQTLAVIRRRLPRCLIVALLLLSGVHHNPGPSTSQPIFTAPYQDPPSGSQPVFNITNPSASQPVFNNANPSASQPFLLNPSQSLPTCQPAPTNAN